MKNVKVHGSLWKLMEVLELGGNFMEVLWQLLEVYELVEVGGSI